MNGTRGYTLHRQASYAFAIALGLVGASRSAAAQSASDDVVYCGNDNYGEEFCMEAYLEVDLYPDTNQAQVYIETDNLFSADQEPSYDYTCVQADLFSSYGDLSPTTGSDAWCSPSSSAYLIEEYDNATGGLFTDNGISDIGFVDWCDYTTEYLCLYDEETYTSVSVAALPSIQSISPDSDTIGNSGTMTVTGENLFVPNTCLTDPSISDPAILVAPAGAPNCATGTSAWVSYTITSSATPGNDAFWVSNGAGVSNTVAFGVIPQ